MYSYASVIIIIIIIIMGSEVHSITSPTHTHSSPARGVTCPNEGLRTEAQRYNSSIICTTRLYRG